MNECLFCKIVEGKIPTHSIFENDKVKVFLDIHPHFPGHLLIICKDHYQNIVDIDIDVLKEINIVTKKMYELLNLKLNPIGIKIIQNNGSCQDILHYHVHMVPTYKNDLKKSLEEVYQILTN